MSKVDQARLTQYYQDEYRKVAGIGGADAMFIYRPRANGFVEMARQHFDAPPRRIFEVGAGLGINLAAMGRAYPEAELLTDELDRSVTLDARIRSGSLDHGPYDLIIMSHVLEHFTDPATFLARACGALSPSGLLFIEVPHETDGEMRAQAFVEPHLTFFDPGSLAHLVGRSLDIVDAFQVGPPPRTGASKPGLVQWLKAIARRTWGLKTILDRRRGGLVIDLSTRQSVGAYLRIVARR